VRRVGAATGSTRDASAIASWIASIRADKIPWRRQAALLGLADGVRGPGARRAVGERERASLLELFEHGDKAALAVLDQVGLGAAAAVEAALARAARLAADPDADAERRADAVGLLRLGGPAKYADLLRELLAPAHPEAVQAAAAAASGEIDSDA
jgi:hypothetical protein